MAKKTNLGIYKAAQEKWDKANTPHESETAFALLYEEARLEWLKLKLKDFERTEFSRTVTWPFLRKKSFGETRIIPLSGVLPDRIFMRGRLSGDYEFECSGIRTTRNLPIVPRTWDNEISTDPFNQPDDTEPTYYDENEGTGAYIQVLTPSTPKNVVLRYIKYPAEYQIIDQPDGFTEEEENEQNEIIDLAVEKHFAKIADYQALQAQQNEVANKGI